MPDLNLALNPADLWGDDDNVIDFDAAREAFENLKEACRDAVEADAGPLVQEVRPRARSHGQNAFKEGRKSSFTSQNGPRGWGYADWENGHSGDCFAFVQNHGEAYSFPDAVEFVAVLYGLTDANIPQFTPAQRAEREAKREEKARQQEAWNRDFHVSRAKVWRDSADLITAETGPCESARQYLQGRGLDIATAERSGVRAREWGDQIAISYPAGGDACQAKGLTEYGHKTGWIQSYNTVGKKGFLARAEAHTDPTFLALTEGPEDALTIAQCANIDTMAALGLHQIRELEIPDDVSRILLVGDAPGQDGERASLDAAKAALEGRGFAVDLLLPPAGHKDANDLLIAEGVDAVRAWVHGRDQEGPDDDEAARARREMHDALPRPGLEVAEATARANDAFHMAIEKSWSYVADAKTAKGDPDALEAKAQAIREGREAVKVADQIDWQHTELAASIHLPDRHAKAVKRLERLERRAERLEADPETLAAQYERRAGDIRERKAAMLVKWPHGPVSHEFVLTAGSGKTEIAIRRIFQKWILNPVRIDFFAPTRQLRDELYARWMAHAAKAGPKIAAKATVIRARMEGEKEEFTILCDRAGEELDFKQGDGKLFQQLRNLDIGFKGKACKKQVAGETVVCRLFDQCSYFRQFAPLKQADGVGFFTTAHLTTPPPDGVKRPLVAVVDEDVSSVGIADWKTTYQTIDSGPRVSVAEIIAPRPRLHGAENDDALICQRRDGTADPRCGLTYAAHQNYRRVLVSLYENAALGEGKILDLLRNAGFTPELLEQMAFAERKLDRTLSRMTPRDHLSDLAKEAFATPRSAQADTYRVFEVLAMEMRAGQSASLGTLARMGEAGGRQRLQAICHFHRDRFERIEGACLFSLNANGNETISKAVYRRPGLQTVKIDFKLNAEIIQFPHSCSKNRIKGSADLRAGIVAQARKLIAERGRLLIVSTKQVRPILEAELAPELDAKAVAFEHFRNLRGIDGHKDCPAVMVVGRTFLPALEIIAKARSTFAGVDGRPFQMTPCAAKLDAEGSAPSDTHKAYRLQKGETLTALDGSKQTVGPWRYADHRLEMVAALTDADEIEQGAHRVRAVHGERKMICILGDQPIAGLVPDSIEALPGMVPDRVSASVSQAPNRQKQVTAQDEKAGKILAELDAKKALILDNDTLSRVLSCGIRTAKGVKSELVKKIKSLSQSDGINLQGARPANIKNKRALHPVTWTMLLTYRKAGSNAQPSYALALEMDQDSAIARIENLIGAKVNLVECFTANLADLSGQ